SGAPFGQPARFPGTVSVIPTRLNTVVATVGVGTRPAGVALTPPVFSDGISFQAPVDYATGQSPQSVAAGDFRGNGRKDLAVANQGSNSVSMLLGNGDGTFNAAATIPAKGPATSVAVDDLNGDGKLDLAVTTTGPVFRQGPPSFTLPGAVSIFLGKGDGTF